MSQEQEEQLEFDTEDQVLSLLIKWSVPTPIVSTINKVCSVSPPPNVVRCPPSPVYVFPTLIVAYIKKVCKARFYCVVPSPPPKCTSVPLPHSALSWIISWESGKF